MHRPVSPPELGGLAEQAPKLRQVRSEIERIDYRSVAGSRRAFAAIARLLENSASAALRRTVISAMRDLILNAGDAKGNVVPSSVREVRKLALELNAAS